VVDRYPTPTWRISLGLGKSHSPGVQGQVVSSTTGSVIGV
jgi:hypothetical protein